LTLLSQSEAVIIMAGYESSPRRLS